MKRILFVFLSLVCVAALAVTGQDLGPNLALHIMPNVDSSIEPGTAFEFFPVHLTDSTYDARNDPANGHGVEPPDTWSSDETNVDHWAEVDFGEAKTVGTVRIFWAYNWFREDFMAAQEIRAQIWDGSAYLDVAFAYPTQGVFPAYSDSITTLAFTPVPTSKVRIFLPAGMSYWQYPNPLWVCELEVFSIQAGIATRQPFARRPTINSTVPFFAGNLANGHAWSPSFVRGEVFGIYDVVGKKAGEFGSKGEFDLWRKQQLSNGRYWMVLDQGNNEADKTRR